MEMDGIPILARPAGNSACSGRTNSVLMNPAKGSGSEFWGRQFERKGDEWRPSWLMQSLWNTSSLQL